jgi:hypothetical protein
MTLSARHRSALAGAQQVDASLLWQEWQTIVASLGRHRRGRFRWQWGRRAARHEGHRSSQGTKSRPCAGVGMTASPLLLPSRSAEPNGLSLLQRGAGDCWIGVADAALRHCETAGAPSGGTLAANCSGRGIARRRRKIFTSESSATLCRRSTSKPEPGGYVDLARGCRPSRASRPGCPLRSCGASAKTAARTNRRADNCHVTNAMVEARPVRGHPAICDTCRYKREARSGG